MKDVPSIKMEVNIPGERIMSIMMDSYESIGKEMEKSVKETMWKFHTGELKIDVSDVVEQTMRSSVETLIKDVVRKVFYEQTKDGSEIRSLLENLAKETIRKAVKKQPYQL